MIDEKWLTLQANIAQLQRNNSLLKNTNEKQSELIKRLLLDNEKLKKRCTNLESQVQELQIVNDDLTMENELVTAQFYNIRRELRKLACNG